jgi:beta-lactamase class A
MASDCRVWVLHLRRLNVCWGTRKVGSPCTFKSWIMRNFFNTFALSLSLAAALGITASAASAPAHAGEANNKADMIATADEKLKTEIDGYWKKFPGRAGIAIYTPFSDEVIGKRQTERFPQQSVSKMWVALTILEQEAAGKLSLDKRIRITRDDVVVFNQPLKNYLDGRDSFEMSLRELLAHSINASDNMANNVLLRVAGGPQAINQMLERRKVQSIRFGPGEVLLQSAIAGLEWKTEYRNGNAFKAQRSTIPMAKRKSALDAYLETPLDGAAPGTIALVLKRFSERDANDPGAKLLKLMAGTYTGRSRLRSGLAPGWRLAHKTGTGQVLESISTAINDVGVMRAPDGCAYPVAVMIAETRAGKEVTNGLMQNVARAITRHHEHIHPKAKAAEANPKPKQAAKPTKTDDKDSTKTTLPKVTKLLQP